MVAEQIAEVNLGPDLDRAVPQRYPPAQSWIECRRWRSTDVS